MTRKELLELLGREGLPKRMLLQFDSGENVVLDEEATGVLLAVADDDGMGARMLSTGLTPNTMAAIMISLAKNIQANRPENKHGELVLKLIEILIREDDE